jgi:FMN phosphatase YigB (HAD superfamily)
MIKGIIFDFNRTLYDPDTQQLTPGVLKILDTLIKDGYKLCLLSKKTKDERREQIAQLGLDKYFLNIQVVEGEKTESNLQECTRIMNTTYSQTAIVGDRVKSEIRLGNILGMKTIWYKSGKFANETPQNALEQPKYIITNLEDMIKHIRF